MELLAPGTRIASKHSVSSDSVALPMNKSANAMGSRDSSAERVTDDGQRFDFYKILPGNTNTLPGSHLAKPKRESTDTGQAAERLYLQFGAFQHQDDADNMKAKLALLGVEANIQSVNLPDKGLLHRVRVGPFTRQENIDSARAKLKADGIEANIVRMTN